MNNCVLLGFHSDLFYNPLLILTDLIPDVARRHILLPLLTRKHELVLLVILLQLRGELFLMLLVDRDSPVSSKVDESVRDIDLT